MMQTPWQYALPMSIRSNINFCMLITISISQSCSGEVIIKLLPDAYTHYTTLYTHIRTVSTDYRELILVEVKSRELA